MSDVTQQPQRFVVGLDFSEFSKGAFDRALALAAREPSAEVHVIGVLGLVATAGRAGDVVETASGHEVEDAALRLRDHVQALCDDSPVARERIGTGALRVVSHLRMGSPAEEIAQLAADLDADLVVVGTHGRRGLRRLLLGSVAEGAVRLAHCPVLVVRPKDHSGSRSEVPAIAPPCPRCVETRAVTQGAELWCEQHRGKHGQRHTYFAVEASRGSRSSLPSTVW